MLSQFKKIIKAVFISGALMMPFGVAAQGMDDPQVDGFTHEITIYTTGWIIASTTADGNLAAWFSRTGDTTYRLHIRCKLLSDNYDHYRVSRGSHVLLKLVDNSLITLPVMTDVEAGVLEIKGSSYTNQYWDATMVFYMSRDEIYKISQADFTGARVEADDKYIDLGMTPKQSLLLNKLAALMLSQK
jgi:hypothetical protein